MICIAFHTLEHYDYFYDTASNHKSVVLFDHSSHHRFAAAADTPLAVAYSLSASDDYDRAKLNTAGSRAYHFLPGDLAVDSSCNRICHRLRHHLWHCLGA